MLPTVDHAPSPALNEVHLIGRVSGPPLERELPSGDVVVTLRLVVDREPGDTEGPRRVDTLDLACWAGRPRRTALALDDGATVEVHGALRRRFFRAGGAPASRYEVEVASVRRVRHRGAARA